MTPENIIRQTPVREVIPVRLTEQIDAIFSIDTGNNVLDAYNYVTDNILLTFQHSNNDKIRARSNHVSKLIEKHRLGAISKADEIMLRGVNDEPLRHFRESLAAIIDQFDLAEENLVTTDANPT